MHKDCVKPPGMHVNLSKRGVACTLHVTPGDVANLSEKGLVGVHATLSEKGVACMILHATPRNFMETPVKGLALGLCSIPFERRLAWVAYKTLWKGVCMELHSNPSEKLQTPLRGICVQTLCRPSFEEWDSSKHLSSDPTSRGQWLKTWP